MTKKKNCPRSMATQIDTVHCGAMNVMISKSWSCRISTSCDLLFKEYSVQHLNAMRQKIIPEYDKNLLA